MTDLETCSWCTDEVEDSELVSTFDGSRICPLCAVRHCMICGEKLRDTDDDVTEVVDPATHERYNGHASCAAAEDLELA